MLTVHTIAEQVPCSVTGYLVPDDKPMWTETCTNSQLLQYKYLRKNTVHFAE